MESLIRNVDDIDSQDRQALEHLLGRSLGRDQQLIINIVTLSCNQGDEPSVVAQPNLEPELPDWCKVYGGLSDTEIAEVESTILNRVDLSRE